MKKSQWVVVTDWGSAVSFLHCFDELLVILCEGHLVLKHLSHLSAKAGFWNK